MEIETDHWVSVLIKRKNKIRLGQLKLDLQARSYDSVISKLLDNWDHATA